MSSYIFKPHATVATVVCDGSRYLMVEERVRGRVMINQPAGHLDPRETLVAAARREALEETGYTLAIDRLVGIYQWRGAQGTEFLRVTFSGSVLDHDPAMELDEGIIRALWLTRVELLKRRGELRNPMVLRNIEDYERGQGAPLDLLCHLNPGDSP